MKEKKTGFPLIILVALIAVFLIIGYAVWLGVYRKVEVPNLITSEEQFYKVVADNVAKYKTNITCRLTFDPGSVDYDRMFSEILARDTYIGSQIYSYSYTYTITGSAYKVNIKINDAAPHRTLLTKMRVKQIANDVKGADDYAKVKAVHDYLILSNKYSYTVAGAFNTLYVGKSSCNGYAYSFYAIMEELGIPVTCEFGGNHAWNKVCIDGEWYNIDLTWDDAGGRRVSYDYFLKCDADWQGHAHGGATAKQSLEPTGRSALQNYNSFPNYRLITIIIVALIAAAIIAIIKISEKRREHKEFMKLYGNE